MKRKHLSTLTMILIILLPTAAFFAQTAPPAKAQNQTTFADNFDTDTNAWQYRGSARQDVANSNVILTDAVGGQGGVAWFKTPVEGAFTANFSYKAGGGQYGTGDGFALFFYKQPYTEIATGGNLGFNGWEKSNPGYGVEFDSYQGLGDPSGYHVALIQDVFSNHLTYVNELRVADNQWHKVGVEVQESSLKVFLDEDLALQWTGDFNKTYDGFGFCAATGSAASYHLIDDFSITYQTPQPPTISVSCKSTTSYSNFKVQINGNLSLNGKGISNAPILLSYSVTGGESWIDLTLVNTDANGDYSAVWLPSVTGNYMLKATFRGNEAYQSASATINFAVEPNSEQNVFSVTSNSTISGLSFDSTKKELNFNVSGTNGTSGYVVVCIPNALISNISDLKVCVDGSQVEFFADAQSDCWVLYLTYHHSIHIVTINLASAASTAEANPINEDLEPYIALIVAASIAVIAVVLIAAFRSWKKSSDITENTEKQG